MAQLRSIPVLPSEVVEPELKVCKLGKHHAAKIHFAIGGKTLCGRDSLTHLRKTKFDFSRKCCRFCCNLAIPQKLGEVRGAGHPAIAGAKKPMFRWLRKNRCLTAYPHHDRGWN